MNHTHDPAQQSFVVSGNTAETDFPLQNLPFGVFRQAPESWARCGVRIGDEVLDLQRVGRAGLLPGAMLDPTGRPDLAGIMALGCEDASALRAHLFELLAATQSRQTEVAACLVPANAVTMVMPLSPPNFTDFLTSSFHKTRLGNPKLDANFMSLPLAYHSRASSVRVSGEVIRPRVQQGSPGAIRFAPTREMDYELELGVFVGRGNAQGQPIALHDAPAHLFGYCLLNDWSVRDIQRWESAPLGPFLAKSLATTVSPWIVTEEALRPFRVPSFARAPDETAAPEYLTSEHDASHGGLGIVLEAWLQTPLMREPARITVSDASHLYWTFAQMLTHHASNGCNLMTGDLLGSGTVSGPTPESRACLAELTQRGTVPLTLPNGETRSWLEDGDEVVLRGRASRNGFKSIGFGECKGTIAPAVPWPARDPNEIRIAS